MFILITNFIYIIIFIFELQDNFKKFIFQYYTLQPTSSLILPSFPHKLWSSHPTPVRHTCSLVLQRRQVSCFYLKKKVKGQEKDNNTIIQTKHIFHCMYACKYCISLSWPKEERVARRKSVSFFLSFIISFGSEVCSK